MTAVSSATARYEVTDEFLNLAPRVATRSRNVTCTRLIKIGELAVNK